MGAVNYYTSDYITVGLIPFDSDDFIDEDENIDYEAMNFEYEYMYETIETILKKYDFYYFHVVIKPGYYDGFTIDIENNFSICFDTWEDKRNAQKEITQIKLFLLECINFGMVKVCPGWSTSYYTTEETKKELNSAILEMREEVKNTPTYNKYFRED